MKSIQSTPSESVEHTLLHTCGIDRSHIQRCLGNMMRKGVAEADLYFQGIASEVWSFEDGQIKTRDASIDHGVGVRAMCGEQVAFAYTDGIQQDALEKAVASVGILGQHGGAANIQCHSQAMMAPLYGHDNPLDSLPADEKVQLLARMDQLARSLDPRVKQVQLSLSGRYEWVLIARHDGLVVTDRRPLVRLDVQVVAQQGDRRESAMAGGGGRYDYGFFLGDDDAPAAYVKEAVRLACLNLDAKDAPAGDMPVILGAGWPGVLFHEAVGHGLEGDFNRKKSSVFSGRIGEQVASPLCTIVDDGHIPHRRGSLTVDDEGTPTQRTVLVERGVLKQYMQDRHNARLMGCASTGNGRRESYAHMPMPRMTNTFLEAGQHTLEEMLETVDRGIYAVNFSGGQVDITSGQFVFSTSEAYMIENGKITTPIKHATLIGSGMDVLQKISMVGSDWSLDTGIGVCGKAGQSVPVGVGQPTLKIDAMTVGGQSLDA